MEQFLGLRDRWTGHLTATTTVAINAVMNPFKGVLPSSWGGECAPRVAWRSIEHPSIADGRVCWGGRQRSLAEAEAEGPLRLTSR